MREIINEKLANVREKGYVSPGLILSLTSYFSVPKGDHDVRIVYDGTRSGLNSSLWAPWFPLPTIETHLRAVGIGTYMGDIDIGEMFLNFMLHPRIRPYAGLDLTPYFREELSCIGKAPSVVWERWNQCTMGFKPSPYQAVQGILMAEEVILGDPGDPTNIFHWDEIALNLPGSPTYLLDRPWVSMVKGPDRTIACDLFIYVDDVKTTGRTFLECRAASRKVASTLGHLGLQHAARKRREPSVTPGPWAGSIVEAGGTSVVVMVSPERWTKAKSMIAWIEHEINSAPQLDFKTLERY
jgi:hypothetical protein